jgi:hypothetical protein
MRLLNLARAAFEAEGLHLRRQARARGIQAALAGAAVVFVLLLLGMLHLAAFAALMPAWGAAPAALILAGGDLVVALVLAIAARRAGHDRVGAEALAVRQMAVRELGDGAARALVLAPLLRGGGVAKGLLGAALTAAVVGLMARR